MANEAGDNTEDKGKAGAGDKGAGDKGAGAAGDKGGAGGGGDEGGGEKTYTQAELDAALATDRQARKRAAAAKAGKPGAATQKKSGDGTEDDGAHEAALAAERKRAEDAESQLRVRDARDAVESAAKAAGFANPSKIYRLIKDELSFGDDGKPDNVKDLITIAKKDFPEELGSKAGGSADGGAGANSRLPAGGGMNAIIRRAAGYQ